MKTFDNLNEAFAYASTLPQGSYEISQNLDGTVVVTDVTSS